MLMSLRERAPESISSGHSIILLDRRYSDNEGFESAIIPFKIADYGVDTQRRVYWTVGTVPANTAILVGEI